MYVVGGANRLVCNTPEEREVALQHCHDNPATGGHFGYNNTQSKLNDSYYWRTIRTTGVTFVVYRFRRAYIDGYSALGVVYEVSLEVVMTTRA